MALRISEVAGVATPRTLARRLNGSRSRCDCSCERAVDLVTGRDVDAQRDTVPRVGRDRGISGGSLSTEQVEGIQSESQAAHRERYVVVVGAIVLVPPNRSVEGSERGNTARAQRDDRDPLRNRHERIMRRLPL